MKLSLELFKFFDVLWHRVVFHSSNSVCVRFQSKWGDDINKVHDFLLNKLKLG